MHFGFKDVILLHGGHWAMVQSVHHTIHHIPTLHLHVHHSTKIHSKQNFNSDILQS